MHTVRENRIVIIAIISIIAVILIIAGAFVYITTDLFKSNDELFYKYLGKMLENFEVPVNLQLSTISKLQKQMPYEINGQLLIQDSNNGSKLNGTKVIVNGKSNPNQSKSYIQAKVYNGENNIFDIEYANTNDIYALKSKEVLTAFLGIKNENLNELVNKIGINNNINITNKLNTINLEQLLEISEKDKQYITENYITILRENIQSKSYSKEQNVSIIKNGKTYNTTGYRVNLSFDDLKNIKIKLLETLKQDSITLNIIATKAKMLGLDERYTQINNLTVQIQNKISEIQNESLEIQNGISIVIYVENEKVIQTEIILKNDVKYIIGIEQNNNIKNYNFLMERLNRQEKYNTIEIKIQRLPGTMESSLNVELLIDNKNKVNIYLQNEGTATEKYLNTDCDISILNSENEYILNYNGQMVFKENVEGIITLNENNCAILNDYTEEQNKQIIQSLIQRIKTSILERYFN